MRLLTKPEKELISKITQIANGSSSAIPAYKFLLADLDIASLDWEFSCKIVTRTNSRQTDSDSLRFAYITEWPRVFEVG